MYSLALAIAVKLDTIGERLFAIPVMFKAKGNVICIITKASR